MEGGLTEYLFCVMSVDVHSTEREETAAAKITVNHNGSLRVEGEIEIYDPNGGKYDPRCREKSGISLSVGGCRRLFQMTVLRIPNEATASETTHSWERSHRNRY